MEFNLLFYVKSHIGGRLFFMLKRPQLRKTKRAKKNENKIYTMDDARTLVIKLKKLEGLSKSSIENYDKFFNDMDRFFSDKMDVSTLTNADGRDFIYWQLHEKTPFLNNPR